MKMSDEEFARQLHEELQDSPPLSRVNSNTTPSVSVGGTYAAPPPGGFTSPHVEPSISLQPFDAIALEEPSLTSTLDFASLVSLNRKSVTVKLMAFIDFVSGEQLFRISNLLIRCLDCMVCWY